jgi:hypothetical protein
MKETVLVLIICVLLYFVVNFAFDKKDKEIMKNCFYSCAYVTKKNEYGELAKGGRYGAGASVESVDFFYEIDGQKYYDRCAIPKKSGVVKNGDKYLMLISKEDRAKYIVMFKYPIKDSTDFKRYVKEFEELRKQQK